MRNRSELLFPASISFHFFQSNTHRQWRTRTTAVNTLLEINTKFQFLFLNVFNKWSDSF